MQPDTAMFFAAGLGTRMRPLTETRPKPLITVGQATLLDHALDLGAKAGLRRMVVNTHYLGQMVRSHVAGRGVLVSDEADQLLDTGGGLKAALPLVGDGPVFTMNTDAIWRGPNPFAALSAAWDPDRMGALLLLVPPDSALGHTGAGDFEVAGDGRLRRGPGLIYTGAQILHGGLAADVPEKVFSLNLIWSALAEEGRLFGLPYAGAWCDVGQPQSIALAETLLDQDANV